MPEAKRRLKNFNFSAPDAHIALVDQAANGLSVLVKKSFSDFDKWDRESGEFVPLEESGLKVNMSLEDILLFFTNLFPEDIETLTAAITKAADGNELGDLLQKSEVVPDDVFTARREEFGDLLKKLDEDSMKVLRQASTIVKDFLDRGEETSDQPDTVEKSKMSDENKTGVDENLEKGANGADDGAEASGAVVPESVQKALDENQATINKQAETIARLEKAEEDRQTASFITKAKSFVEKGASLPEVAEDKDAATEFGIALKALAKAEPEAFAQVESVLEKALETVEKGENLEEIGENGQPNVSNAETDLSKAAEAIQKEEPGLSREAAIAKALEANPALYEG